MLIKSIKIDKNKRVWIIMLTAVIIAVVLIATTCILVGKEHKKFTGITELLSDPDIFSTSSYYTEYLVHIQSNKNSNHYVMKEWYQKDKEEQEKFKYQMVNESGENVEYTIENNTLKMKSDAQKAEYSLSDYVVQKNNLLSLSTFIALYQKIEQETQNTSDTCCKIETQTIDNFVYYRIIFDLEKVQKHQDTCNICKDYASILKKGNQVSKLELVVKQDSKLPSEYLVYNEKEEAYIDITYNLFEVNT